MSDYTVMSLWIFFIASLVIVPQCLSSKWVAMVFYDLIRFKLFQYSWVDKFFTLLVVGIIINAIVAAILHLT